MRRKLNIVPKTAQKMLGMMVLKKQLTDEKKLNMVPKTAQSMIVIMKLLTFVNKVVYGTKDCVEDDNHEQAIFQLVES